MEKFLILVPHSTTHQVVDQCSETRKSNIRVWEDTFKQSDSGFFKDVPVHPSIKYTFDQLDAVDMKPKYPDPILDIINEDTFTVAEKLYHEGYNPLVLNMACDTHPGGGVRKGAFAQEENLLRSSNYYKFLPHVPAFYPIATDEIIYSPNVLVFKDKYYNIVRQPFHVACVACAAIRNPKVCWTVDAVKPRQVFLKDEDYELTRRKIASLFQLAYTEGHDSLVLGALGCGAFHNPPEQIAEIFNEFLQKYKYCFKYICFAVLSVKDHNYEIFSRIIRF